MGSIEQGLARIRQGAAGLPGFELRMWDGTSIVTGDRSRFTAHVRRPEALAALFARPDYLSLGEAYLRDDLDIDGDVEAIFPVASWLCDEFTDGDPLGLDRLETAFQPEAGAASHDPSRDKAAIAYHYDLSNRVFGAITGPTRMYSCAYFHSEDDDLDTAQAQKLDRVCRKLGLEAGERFLDIGCGWGGLLLHAARHHGVHADGITISEQQLQCVNERIAQAELGDRVRARLLDYRDLEGGGRWDKIASLGMIEHVGLAKLPAYFARAFDALAPGGTFVVQGVATNPNRASTTEASPFATTYVFPDADMPFLGQYLDAAVAAGFEVRDVENLREHYALTHRLWRRNLERHEAEITAEIGRERYRALRLMYGYSTHFFLDGLAEVHQIVLQRPVRGVLPRSWRRPL